MASGGGHDASLRLFAVLGVLVMMIAALPIVYDDTVDAAGDYLHTEINYNSNGGRAGPGDLEIMMVSTAIMTISTIVPIKDGYSFMGWAVVSNPTVPKYMPGDQTSSENPNYSDCWDDWDRTIVSSATLNLIAVWEEDPSATDGGISFIGDYTGTGTAEDPFDGELIYTDFTEWTELNGCYFTVGTTISAGDSYPSKGDGEWSISEGFGLTINHNSNGLLGTFAHSGTIEITKSELDGHTETYRIYCVDSIPDLEFLSDPTSGTITYVS